MQLLLILMSLCPLPLPSLLGIDLELKEMLDEVVKLLSLPLFLLRVMKLNVLWLVILVVSTCVCPSVPDPFKHRMKRVGIAGFPQVSVLLGSISSLLGPTRLFYYIPFPFLGEPVPLPESWNGDVSS